MKYYHRMFLLRARLLSVIPHDAHVNDAGPWLERAVKLSALRVHLRQRMSERETREYIIDLVERKRNFKMTHWCYMKLVRAGNEPLFARYWKKVYHDSRQALQTHYIVFTGFGKTDAAFARGLEFTGGYHGQDFYY